MANLNTFVENQRHIKPAVLKFIDSHTVLDYNTQCDSKELCSMYHNVKQPERYNVGRFSAEGEIQRMHARDAEREQKYLRHILLTIVICASQPAVHDSHLVGCQRSFKHA